MCHKATLDWFVKKVFGRGAGLHKQQCPDGFEAHDSLCYPKCTDGYQGDGPKCQKRCNGSTPIDCGGACAANDNFCQDKALTKLTPSSESP